MTTSLLCRIHVGSTGTSRHVWSVTLCVVVKKDESKAGGDTAGTAVASSYGDTCYQNMAEVLHSRMQSEQHHHHHHHHHYHQSQQHDSNTYQTQQQQQQQQAAGSPIITDNEGRESTRIQYATIVCASTDPDTVSPSCRQGRF